MENLNQIEEEDPKITKLRLVMTKKRKSQKWLVDVTKLNKATINNAVNGHTAPVTHTLKLISKALNVPITEIMED